MDEYLIEMKETINLVEDGGVLLPKEMVVWYIIKKPFKR